MTIYFTYSVDPDIYYDVEGLTDTVSMGVPIGISNGEDVTLWFKVELILPPTGYISYSQNLGSLTAGSSGWYIFTFTRSLPTLTNGELDEALLVRITAYYDAEYSNPYGYANSATTMHFFSSLDEAWTMIDRDTFDDGTIEGWNLSTDVADPSMVARVDSLPVSGDHFISAPYGLSLYNSTSSSKSAIKNFTIGAVTKARLIIHFWIAGAPFNPNLAIKIGSDLFMPAAIGLLCPRTKWIRVAFPLPINATTKVIIQISQPSGNKLFYIDEIRCVTK